MRAILCRAFGPPEDLTLEDVEAPKPGPGELLVDVRAAGVGFPDALIIQDLYQFKATPPFTPGAEVAGVVTALGDGVEGIAVGDRVCAGLMVGGFAEQAVVAAANARKLPDDLAFEDATGFLYSYGTTLYALRDRAQLQPGETLLVLGAGGNLGLGAVELGKLMGARVIAAASSDEKLARCREAGADEGIQYSNEDLKQRAKELTDGKGVDVIYDPVGGEYAETALRAIAWEGRYLVIGFTAGIPKIPLNLALLKSCQIVGVFLGAMAGRTPQHAAAILKQIDEWAASGKLAPSATRKYSLEDAPQALRDLIDRKAIGRVVVTP